MLYIAIKPAQESVEFFDFDGDANDACAHVGLERGAIDHGNLARTPDGNGLAIIVYEFGLKEPDKTEFFSIGQLLLQGNAICYAYDWTGATVDVDKNWLTVVMRSIVFYHSRADVERAIIDGRVDRPQVSVNADILWEWHP